MKTKKVLSYSNRGRLHRVMGESFSWEVMFPLSFKVEG